MPYANFTPLSSDPQPIKLQRFDVPEGNAGVGRTLVMMSAIALGSEGAQNPQIIALARRILVEQRVPSMDESAEAHTLSNWVRDTIRFTGEHNDAVQDSLQTPVVTLKMRTGDCDDFATLLSALLHSVGILNRFKVVKPMGAENDPTAPYSHVYVVATNKRTGEQLMLDPTMLDSSGSSFSNMQVNSGGAEFGLGQLRGLAGPVAVACPGGLGCPGCDGRCKGARMPGLGDLTSTLTSVLNSPALTALAQGEATNIAYGNRSSLNTIQTSTAPNPFATPAQLNTGQPGLIPGLSPVVPTWLWIVGAGAAVLVFYQFSKK